MVSAKDVVLEVLRRLSVKGGVGKILEYAGEGVATLSVPQRGTITNMGAELGATTSVFPSDEVTKRFLEAQGRGVDFVPLSADPGAVYDEELVIDLSSLEPLIALPHMPDRVVPVREVAGLPVDQCFIGSCTNSSYYDLAVSAAILRGRRVAEKTSLVVGPGSRQTFLMIAKDGILSDMVKAGARILECACGPCIGIGQAPRTDAVSLRTSNRNFEGRSGTKSARVHLVSAETAAASAVRGLITDPREFAGSVSVGVPERFMADDGMFVFPRASSAEVAVRRGPNIAPLPVFAPLADTIEGEVLLAMGDNITTDHILPRKQDHVAAFESPAISEYCFLGYRSPFRVKSAGAGGGIVVGGENYGQGQAGNIRLSPRFLAYARLSFFPMRGSTAKSRERGIIASCFREAENFKMVSQAIDFPSPISGCLAKDSFEVRNETTGVFLREAWLSGRQVELLLARALNAARRELAGSRAGRGGSMA